MHYLNISDLDYLHAEETVTVHGGVFQVPTFTVTTKTNTQASTAVRSNVNITPAPGVGLSYNNALASGYATGLAVSLNGRTVLDVNAGATIS